MRAARLASMILCSLAAGPAVGADANPAGAPAAWPMPDMGQVTLAALFVDRLERGDGGDGDSVLWDAQGWIGGDYRKLWIKTEGEGPAGRSPDVAEVQLLYDRNVGSFWNLQAGGRYVHGPDGADTAYAVVGVQGLAPQWFEMDSAAFLSEHGDLSARAEVEYDLLLTQRLVLQPRLEVDVSATDVPELGTGSGLSATEAGLRLRYEIRRELAPYLGVRWERLYGDTGDLARAAGEPVSRLWFVVGIRAWL